MVISSSSQQQGLEHDDASGYRTGQNSDVAVAPPPNVIRLWQEVALGIDRSQTVVWKAAVETLEHALRYLLTSSDARRFVEGYMRPCISILLDQQPMKIGPIEKNCVEESLRRAVQIVAKDLDQKKGALDCTDGSQLQECLVLDTLSFVFNRKKTYYKVSTLNWKAPCGAPEVRVQNINRFHTVGGWNNLATYLVNRARWRPEQFPSAEVIHHILGALSEIVPSNFNNNRQSSADFRGAEAEDFTIRICHSVMNYIEKTSEESSWKRQATDLLSKVLGDLKLIFDKLTSIKRSETFKFYEFWRKLTLKLITSQSLPLRLFGWEQVGDLIEASREMRPPPKCYFVEGAGLSFVNGKYDYGGPIDEDGHATRGGDRSYVRVIPVSDTEGGGMKKITLFRCTMRSQLKWWFISEADEDQPGTDKDIDYYQHKTRTADDSVPPLTGWLTCRSTGHDPPPTLRSSGVMVPAGEELDTLEHQLAKWAISNGAIELVLGDSIHREVVSRSKDLLRFLADMCDKEGSDMIHSRPNEFCLQESHLLLAWKTCTSKADAAVSLEVYNLLVSILPSLPVDLAICLISAIQKSLQDGTNGDKYDFLPEVSDFCSALAKGSSSENSNAPAPVLSDRARIEILKLLWQVLTHPGAPSLKTYQQLMQYVGSELQVEPHGELHRLSFLKSCMKDITTISEVQTGEIDEASALQKVKLTRFILETCPQRQAITLVTNETPQLPLLMFKELQSYLMRRYSTPVSPNSRRVSNCFVSVAAQFHEFGVLFSLAACFVCFIIDGFQQNSSSLNLNGHAAALFERLSFLQFAYRLSFDARITNSQLDKLWDLCSTPADREALMIFLAEASETNAMKNIVLGAGENVNQALQPSVALVDTDMNMPMPTALSNDTCLHAFNDLICSPDVNWDVLGEKAYHSFHTLFCKLRKAEFSRADLNGPDIDAMWRVFLTSGNSNVASLAMKDLLAVYRSMSPQISSLVGAASNSNVLKFTGESRLGASERSLLERIFECLVQVKKRLEAGDLASERSAERCLRILNVAFGQDTVGFGDATSIPDMSMVESAADALACVPHGMKGQACYRTVNILGKHTPQQHHSVNVGASTSSQPNIALQDDLIGPPTSPTSSVVKTSSTEKFLLNLHPLETLFSIKYKVAQHFKHPADRIKAITISGRNIGKTNPGEIPSPSNLNIVPEDTTVAELGITDGCDIMFLLASNPLPGTSNPPRRSTTKKPYIDLAAVFADGHPQRSADHFFDTLLSILETLPVSEVVGEDDSTIGIPKDSSALVWDLLLAMSSNPGIVERVNILASGALRSSRGDAAMDCGSSMAMDQIQEYNWSSLLDGSCFHRSVYTLQVVESFLTPAPEILCSIRDESTRIRFQKEMMEDAKVFRRGFINTGGFDAVLRLFTQGSSNGTGSKRRVTRRSDATVLRILKCCFMGNINFSPSDDCFQPDEVGSILMGAVSDPSSLLHRLIEVVVTDPGAPDSLILDSLCLVRLLLSSKPLLTNSFASLPHDFPEKYVTSLLLRKDNHFVAVSAGSPAVWVRKCAENLVTKNLLCFAFPWLTTALQNLELESSDYTFEFFRALNTLVGLNRVDPYALKSLGTVTCKKMTELSRHISLSSSTECATGLLSGCLNVLKQILEISGGEPLVEGAAILVSSSNSQPWSTDKRHALELNPTMSASLSEGNTALIDLMGAIFDGYLSSTSNPLIATPCSDRESRQLAFDVVAIAAKACTGGVGYIAVVRRIDQVITYVAPYLRHRWGLNLTGDEMCSRSLVKATKYSGLRNQGCTCYMNSFLQQLFMMSDLRKVLCSAPIPTRLRSGGVMLSKGTELVGKKISLHWETGMSYEAEVKSFDSITGMHTIQYCAFPLAFSDSDRISSHRTLDYSTFSKEHLDEFILVEGRPGKETGAFEISMQGNENTVITPAGENALEGLSTSTINIQDETEDQACARRLLEEVQRTFVHLEEGARGRCFDPRSLVEASGCLKLEFDVWQQNDASEYAMKLLDRLEVPLKRYAPKHFRYLENTFGLKQTKQKYCKECGLKTNREEKMMNIDCQIRGKSDIHEALETMCEVEYMEGDNKVYCDRCKKKCDTVLRTAISALPKVLVLSLKRFDLDYNTFETVKLNSRCAFGHRLNMRKYTLEGVEAIDAANSKNITVSSSDGDAVMDTVDAVDHCASPKDEDYEYNLVGVLVHAGVAQGGHYYSYIKDRSLSENEAADKWYRFDDEDVSPFDPANIEPECFGGKVKKETKWPNGQLHTVESEQFANALMLFYEKVTPCKKQLDDDEDCTMEDAECMMKDDCSNGYDVFQADVRRANTTHAWCEFLSDSDFQDFMKILMKKCLTQSSTYDEGDKMELSPHRPMSPSQNQIIGSWHLSIFQVSIIYFFNVLLHTFDKSLTSQWVNMFCSAIEQHSVVSQWLTNEIARRTSLFSGNWLRTFCSDCPDETSRLSFMKTILVAIRECSKWRTEKDCLRSWIQAWSSQLPDASCLAPNGPIKIEALPTGLSGKFRHLEDVQKIGTKSVSSIGIIISEITSLLEHSPCSWRNSIDICVLLRDLSCCSVEEIRAALVAAQIPSRLICLTMRESSPTLLKLAFPGSSISQENASLMVRPEAVHQSHSNIPHGMRAGGGVSAKITERHDDDYILLLEALGCLIGLGSVKKSPLLVDELDQKGRIVVKLSKSATAALTQIYNESKSMTGVGMGPREIEQFMKCCGYNPRNHVAQKMMQRMSKHESVPARDGNKELRYLTLVGFLDYYRDFSQGNESQVRSELHVLGFRPDLSRRPLETRIISTSEHRPYDTSESVSLDVAFCLKDRMLSPLGLFAELGLHSFYLYFLPFTNLNQHHQGDILPLIEYILAASSYRSDSTSLLLESLEILSEACNESNNGHDTIHTCIKIFKVLLSIPDDKQNERFQIVMRSNKRIQNYSGAPGIGLLVAARDLSLSRAPQYSNESFHYISAADRYIEIVSILYSSIHSVAEWMSRNRDLWSWMEQRRGDRTREVAAASQRLPPNHQQFSESSIIPGIGNDSDVEDDDFRLVPGENLPRKLVRCEKVEVSGAGLGAINGIYRDSGYVDGVAKYTKLAILNGNGVELSLYRCQLQDTSRKWFISVVPEGQLPGTSRDIDYYWAPCSADVKGNVVPPERNWEIVKNNGVLPPPLLRVTLLDEEVMNVSGQSDCIWNGEEDVIEIESERHPM